MNASARTVAGRLARAVPASVKRALPAEIVGLAGDVYSSAPPERQWAREVMYRDLTEVFRSMRPERLHVVELSGGNWACLPWKSRTRLDYPEFDVCRLLPLHDHPSDYWRFTPTRLRRLLDSQGLPPLWVKARGNRRVVTANFDRWAAYRCGRSPRNEEHLPIVVWALARPR
jgi:hypothetical protein